LNRDPVISRRRATRCVQSQCAGIAGTESSECSRDAGRESQKAQVDGARKAVLRSNLNRRRRAGPRLHTYRTGLGGQREGRPGRHRNQVVDQGLAAGRAPSGRQVKTGNGGEPIAACRDVVQPRGIIGPVAQYVEGRVQEADGGFLIRRRLLVGQSRKSAPQWRSRAGSTHRSLLPVVIDEEHLYRPGQCDVREIAHRIRPAQRRHVHALLIAGDGVGRADSSAAAAPGTLR